MMAQIQEVQSICQRELKIDSEKCPRQHRQFLKQVKGPHPLADRRNFVKKKVAFVSEQEQI